MLTWDPVGSAASVTRVSSAALEERAQDRLQAQRNVDFAVQHPASLNL
jgi:hypothetical protein